MNPDEVFWRLGLAVAGGLLLSTVIVAVAGLPAVLGLVGAFAWSVFAAEVPAAVRGPEGPEGPAGPPGPMGIAGRDGYSPVRESVRGSEVSRGA